MDRDGNATKILAQSAARWPEHPAVIDSLGSYSYHQLQQAAHEVCQALLDRGAEPGTVVGLGLGEARNFLACLFGVLKAGCVAIPVAPNLSLTEQERVLVETGVYYLITSERTTRFPKAEISALSGEARPLALFDISSISIRLCRSGPQPCIYELFPDAAVIRYTSGTTAQSKGVVLSHKAVHERTDASIQLLGLTPADVVLIPLSISYHFIASALSCLKAGATILDGAEQSVPEMLQCGAKQGVSILYASPLQYELISRAEGSCALPTLRRAISTSALLPKRIADLFFERLQVRLTQVYGIIEVGLPLWNEIQSVEPSALGVCKPPYEAKIVDEDGAVVEAGEVGELAVRGPGLFSGYLVGPSTGSSHTLDQCLLQEGWFLTGDLVVQNDVGIVFYHGRKKSVINCGGNKIFPEEVEDVLRSVPAISAVRVSAEPHPLLGSLVIAEIVVVPNQHVSFDALRALCYRELSGYKVPKEFRIVESLPNTASGKVIRHSGEEIVRSV